MSSPCPRLKPLLACASLAALLSLGACDRERRDIRSAPQPESGPSGVQVSDLTPGGGPQSPPDPRGKMYESNAYQISQGKRFFAWFNCSGCHAHGGGGMGPALMDDEWRYGGKIDQIYASIDQGRPNGMPSFHGKIPEQQIWQLAAYVRSLSGNVPSAANGSRGEEMSNIPSPALMKTLPPKSDPSPVTASPP